MNTDEKNNSREQVICIQLNSKEIQTIPIPERAWSLLLTLVFSASLRAKGVLIKDASLDGTRPGSQWPSGGFITREGESIGIFFVTDWKAAVVTIQAELEAQKMALHSKVGWLCDDERIWRSCFPRDSMEDFNPIVERFLQWAKEARPPGYGGPCPSL
jgi:hypothetical protein